MQVAVHVEYRGLDSRIFFCLHTVVIHCHGLVPAITSVTAVLLPFEVSTETSF